MRREILSTNFRKRRRKSTAEVCGAIRRRGRSQGGSMLRSLGLASGSNHWRFSRERRDSTNFYTPIPKFRRDPRCDCRISRNLPVEFAVAISRVATRNRACCSEDDKEKVEKKGKKKGRLTLRDAIPPQSCHFDVSVRRNTPLCSNKDLGKVFFSE